MLLLIVFAKAQKLVCTSRDEELPHVLAIMEYGGGRYDMFQSLIAMKSYYLPKSPSVYIVPALFRGGGLYDECTGQVSELSSMANMRHERSCNPASRKLCWAAPADYCSEGEFVRIANLNTTNGDEVGRVQTVLLGSGTNSSLQVFSEEMHTHAKPGRASPLSIIAFA
jgi:hypothetical protein